MRIQVGTWDAAFVDKVYLDGVLIERVVQLNVAEGWLEYFCLKNDFKVKRKYGAVTIKQRKPFS